MQAQEETIQPVPFGSYALLERLAMGGMAEVFLARPEGQDRLVAVKRILPNIAADDEFIAMFIDEAKIAGQLSHPNIAQIIDIGKISGSYFIAMEYVSGHDLRALWDRTRETARENNDEIRGLPLGLTCHIVKKLAEGLDFAHRRRDAKGRPLGIIHRDVSPQNILISYDGDLKIIDFGIAKAANRIVKTQTGILKGKFAYMAPEQARGEPIDHRSDIFAIGVVLYELLTGERAFKGDTDFALLEKVRRVEVVPAKTLRPDLPKELERILKKALGKDAADRYAWASVLASDLDRFLSDQGVTTSRDELGSFLRRTFREEHGEEVRRLSLYRRVPGGASASRERPRIDGNGATVVRSGPPAKNAQRRAQSDEADGMESTAVGDAVDDGSPATAPLRRDDDEFPAHDPDVPPTNTATPHLRRRAEKASEKSPPVEKPGFNDKAVRSGIGDAMPPPNRPKTTAELEMLRDQAVRVARGDPSSSKAPVSGPDDQGVVSSPSRRRSAPPVSERPERSERAQPAEPSNFGPPADDSRFDPSGEQPPPLDNSRLSSLPQQATARRGNVVVVVACLLGAALGASLGFGISLVSRAPPPDTLIVTVPRQTEVKVKDVVVCAQTPCAVHLGRGRHELLLQAPGVEAVTRSVDVTDGNAVFDIVLERLARGIRIETDPPGALLVVDDVPMKELTPTTLPPLSVGTHVQLLLTRDGFETLTAVRTVEGDAVWHFDLPTPQTVWTVNAVPGDALVDVGAKEGAGKVVVSAGKKPLTVTVRRPGCEPQKITLTGTGKATASQQVQLECRDFDAKLSVSSTWRLGGVKIDGVPLPKSTNLTAYSLPSGTWSVQFTGGARGKRETQTVELRRGETTIVATKVK